MQPKNRAIRFIIGILLSGFLVGGAGAFAQNCAAPLSGVAIRDDGKPIQEIITALKTDLPVYSTAAQTASDGSFVLTDLPDGQYHLCAVDLGGTYLNPCTWSAGE